jgi:hypothetical protein
MEKKEELITNGNIIIINENEPSMAIIPKVDFQTAKISNIFQRIKKLNKQFPNCNFDNCSLLYEKKYDLKTYKNNVSLLKWFKHYKIKKDENNNYIFYIKKSKKRYSVKPRKNKKNKTNKVV